MIIQRDNNHHQVNNMTEEKLLQLLNRADFITFDQIIPKLVTIDGVPLMPSAYSIEYRNYESDAFHVDGTKEMSILLKDRREDPHDGFLWEVLVNTLLTVLPNDKIEFEELILVAQE